MAALVVLGTAMLTAQERDQDRIQDQNLCGVPIFLSRIL